VSESTIAPMTTPSRPRLAASMLRRRQSILDAAVDLFQERGYLGTTVDDIAARAGVTKRTVYHHMGSKEHILSEVHSQFIDEGLRRWEAIAEAGGPAADVLRELIEAHVKIVAVHGKAIAVFFEEAKHLNPDSRAEIDRQRDRYESILRVTIARGVETGEFRSGIDVSVTTLLVLGALTEMYHWYRPKARAAQDETVALCTRLILAGIRAEGAAA
jgi:AcrR family transcriptional regulator